MAAQTRVVCTTVGPYAQYGLPLVAACVAEGAHYCDLTGEVQFMHRSIDQFDAAARARGVRIVHACGFDSIPSDLGVFVMQRAAVAQHGRMMPRVRLYLNGGQGGVSGGTLASMKGLLTEASVDAEVRRVLANPYSLLPEGAPKGPRVSDVVAGSWDADEGKWVGPFVMASTNAPVVRRSHALAGSPLGDQFLYTEVVPLGVGVGAWAKAQGLMVGLGGFVAAMSTAPGRWLLDRFLPQPGEGPSAEAQVKGFFKLDVVGRGDGAEVRCTVRGDKDPGYGATSGMLGESALCLARDTLPDIAGVLTPAAAMGAALVERLPRAGVTFEVR
jgi:short subunit dehydrogenase-like uncharacterized protein